MTTGEDAHNIGTYDMLTMLPITANNFGTAVYGQYAYLLT